MKMLDSEGSSNVFNNAFDASSVRDFTGGNITILYFPSTGTKPSFSMIFRISSTPRVFKFSDATTFISGCSISSSESNKTFEPNIFACLNKWLDVFPKNKYA